MKRITIFVGSARKGNTYQAVKQFTANLNAFGEVECETIMLGSYRLEHCRGCMACFERGEEFCPLKDDRDVLFEKISASDGIVLATPNYLFDMSGIMKTFLDRLGFNGHRPRYFGKTFTSIVTQGIGGGNTINKYFNFAATILGFNAVKGTSLTILNPMTERELMRNDRALKQLSKRFHTRLFETAYPVPSWFMLMGFRMGRSTVKEKADLKSRDYQFFTENGWLESDYFYPTQLGIFKKSAGMLFDRVTPAIRKMIA